VEVDLPLWVGMTTSEVKEQLTADYRTWKELPHEFRMVLQEDSGTREHFPVLALYAQAKQFWQEILPQHQGETILIVGHNGINRALISTALGISPSRYHCLQQSNCGISVLNFAGGLGEPVQLESMNQTQHLGETFPSLRPGHQGVRLLLVRHGETEWNRQGKFQGQIDIPLNDNGRNQAGKAAEFLQNVNIDFAKQERKGNYFQREVVDLLEKVYKIRINLNQKKEINTTELTKSLENLKAKLEVYGEDLKFTEGIYFMRAITQHKTTYDKKLVITK